MQGICGAVTDEELKKSPRIDAFIATTDGFLLAEQDLILRGPGDILGSRQSGSPPLYLADLLKDGDIASEARSDAKTIFESDPALDDDRFSQLKKVLLGRWSATLNLGLEKVS
jgi:ATP-dependent DNA helicase RecG